MDINIKVNKATRDAIPDKNKIGVEGENLQEKLVFYFEDEFVDGVARLEYEQDGVKNYIPLTKIDQTYVVPIKNVITKPWKLNLQLVITENEQSEGIPLFKSDMFEVYITNSINAVGEAPEGYDLWIDIANAKLLLMDEKIDEANDAIENISTAIQETENLDLDVNKIEKETTVEITKKDGTTKSVKIYDGVSLQFMWQGTSLGIKTDDMEEYIFVNLQGIQGVPGPQGEPFRIKKTYSSVAEMYADFDNMNVGDYVMIATSVEIEDNAKLYTKGDLQWIFITDFSGAMGIKGETGATPIIHIGTVTSGDEPSVTISGTAENPIFNFVLKTGPQGQTGATGETGATGNGISTIIKTSTSGLVDTYTITYTNGNTSTFTVTNGEDGEVTQTQLDETNAEVERAMMVYNALPKVSDEDTEITLDGTANCPMKLKLSPSELTQETTTGKNLLSIDNLVVGGTYEYYKFKEDNDNTQYTLSIKLKDGGTPKNMYIGFADDAQSTQGNYSWLLNNGNIGGTIHEDGFKSIKSYFNNVYTSYVRIYRGSGNTLQDLFDNYDIQLAKGDIYQSYEPYTGGIPQPNPDYPSEVQVIKGNNSIKIENKNLFDKNDLSSYGFSGTVDTDGAIIYNWANNYANSIRITGFKENTQYSFTYDAKKYETNSSVAFCAVYYKDGTKSDQRLSDLTTEYKTKTFTTSANKTIDNILFYNGANGNTYSWKLNLDTLLITKGTELGEYVPHQEQVLPLNLPVENLFNNTFNHLGMYQTVPEATGTFAEGDQWLGAYCKVEAGKTYSISRNILTSRFAIGVTNEIPTANTQCLTLARNDDAYKIENITIPTGYSYLILYLSNTSETSTGLNIQIEKGTKANRYTPFGTTPIEYCKIGTCEDEFEHDGDKWYLNKYIGKVVLDGSEQWAALEVSGGGNKRTSTDLNNAPTQASPRVLMLSNYFRFNNDYATDFIGSGFIGAGKVFLYPQQQDNVSNFKTWLTTHNTTVYYRLETPTHTEITDTTLISQLNAIEKALSYDEQTNISQTNTGLPFRIKASAVRSLANIFDLINE